MVIVVDDDEDVREALGDLLRLRGYSVTMAANGREALELLHRCDPPCVILLDLVMPVMDGWQLISQLQMSKVLRDIPVVVISAHAVAMPPAGIEKLLRKPIDLDDLFSTVAKHCVPGS